MLGIAWLIWQYEEENVAQKIRLPHEGENVNRLIRQIKDAIIETRTTVVSGVEITYSICAPWPRGLDLAMYDHDGNIYLPENSVRSDSTRADLTAFHEHTEIRHKLSGRSHAYAHRRGLLEELLAAKQIYDEDGLTVYVHQRVFSYPDWKIPDKDAIKKRICELLAVDRPLRGKLIEVITEARM